MLIESGSSIGKYMACPKSYEFSYVKLLESDSYRSPLGYGNFIHANVEVLSGKGRIGIVDQLLIELLGKHKSAEDQVAIRADYELAKRVARLWYEAWSNPVHPFSNVNVDWIESEYEWKYTLPDSEFIHVGKSDGIMLHKKYNKLFLYELKTAADRSRDTYVHRLMVDKQISSNIIALRARGYNVEGVIYDIVWKPSLIRLKNRKTKPDESIQEFHDRIFEVMKKDPVSHFERHIVYRNDKDIVDYSIDLRSQYETIESSYKRGIFHRNSGNCDNFGTLCQFFTVCIEGKQEMEQMFNKRDRKLPELGLEVQNGDK